MMKKILSIIVFATIVLVSMAQNHTYYCEIKGQEKDLSSGLKIVFDMGNNPVYGTWTSLSSKQKLVTEQGEEIKFNSMVDAGNYLSSKGWKFLQAYSSVYGGDCILHWIFCKDANSPEDAMRGIETKDSYKRKNGQ